MPSSWSSKAVKRAPCNKGRVSSAYTISNWPCSYSLRITPSAVPRPPVAKAPALQCVKIRKFCLPLNKEAPLIAIRVLSSTSSVCIAMASCVMRSTMSSIDVNG